MAAQLTIVDGWNVYCSKLSKGKKNGTPWAHWNPLVAHCLICIDKQLQHNDILNAKMDGIHESEFGVFYIYP